MMKTKITLLFIALVFGFNTNYSQQQEECMNNLSIFSSYVKNKKYDDAYDSWMKVRTDCSPQFNRNVYVGGEKILKHKIENSTGAEQIAFVKDLLTIFKAYHDNFASKYALGNMLEDQGNLSYDFKKELNLSDEDIYKIFDEAYTKDLENFTNPRGLYIYFKMMVSMYDAGKKTPQQLFDKYDDVNDKIEDEVSIITKKLNVLLEKEESGATLTKREAAFKNQHESYLTVYDQISGSLDTEIGNRATCEVLIPIYQKDFEEFKNDAKWLQRAMNKMYAKECTDDPMFIKVVQQKNSIEPNADTAYYLGVLKDKAGQKSEAEQYYKQSMDLQTDPLKKWNLVYRLAENNRKKGAYGKARQLYRDALKLNPSNGAPYIRISQMYAASANNCGDSVFNKKAVYWLAAEEARKAGRIDSRQSKAAAQNAASYEAKAPTKSEIFSGSMSGKVINIGCWIGASVTVP